MNASGQIAEQYTYDIFGVPTTKDGSGNLLSSASTPFLFTGREWDSETGLYHYRARAYSPTLGRFLQADPIDFDGGDANIYRYCANSPINLNDPFGLMGDAGRAIKRGAREAAKKAAGAGRLCTASNCDKKKCPAKMLGETDEDWKKGWVDIPEPGQCADADGVATPKGILKIPNGTTCTIECDSSGKAIDISCTKKPGTPEPQVNPPDFPPNPFTGASQ